MGTQSSNRYVFIPASSVLQQNKENSLVCSASTCHGYMAWEKADLMQASQLVLLPLLSLHTHVYLRPGGIHLWSCWFHTIIRKPRDTLLAAVMLIFSASVLFSLLAYVRASSNMPWHLSPSAGEFSSRETLPGSPNRHGYFVIIRSFGHLVWYVTLFIVRGVAPDDF
jgi:hypothetical protein